VFFVRNLKDCVLELNFEDGFQEVTFSKHDWGFLGCCPSRD